MSQEVKCKNAALIILHKSDLTDLKNYENVCKLFAQGITNRISYPNKPNKQAEFRGGDQAWIT